MVYPYTTLHNIYDLNGLLYTVCDLCLSSISASTIIATDFSTLIVANVLSNFCDRNNCEIYASHYVQYADSG